MSALLLRVSVVCFAFIISACSDSVQHLTKSSKTPSPESLLGSMLVNLDKDPVKNLSTRCYLPGFYQDRYNNLIWTRDGELMPQGDSLVSSLKRVKYLGLLDYEYNLPEIDSLLNGLEKGAVERAAMLDILLTDAYFSLGHHLYRGRVDKNTLSRMDVADSLDSTVIDVLMKSVLVNRVKTGLATLEPNLLHYKRLKAVLANKLDSLQLGITDSIRTILDKQIKLLSINLEKWRWDRYEGKERLILVNIPSYKLEVLYQDSLVFESNVVVGNPSTPTPMLDANIRSFMVFPYWNVPRQIAVDEILPKVKKDSSYLARNHYQVIDIKGSLVNPDSIDWSRYHVNNFPFMFQQTEGEYNALGIVKFPFQSENSIYLHDTNAKQAFRRTNRACSHGCVRVERAIELAKFLVNEKNRYCNTAELDRMLAAREQKLITVNEIDLHIRYFTCEVRPDGSVAYLDDVYQQDQMLESALYCRNN